MNRKIALVAAAGGVLGASIASAQDLDTNLVLNPSFESVDLDDPGPFTSVRILDWEDNDFDGDDTFAYPYSSAYSGDPAPAGAGDFHYTGGFGTTAGEVTILQFIDISGGDAGALIDSGAAFFNLSAFFSSYQEQSDVSSVRATFLDSGADVVGEFQIGGPDFLASVPIVDGQRAWALAGAGGLVPADADTVIVSIVAEVGGTNHDGYVDLVDFRVSATEPAPQSFTIASPTTGGFVSSGDFTIDWADSAFAATYDLVISRNSDLSDPALTVTGITESRFDASVASGETVGPGVWYAQVTANNQQGSIDALNGPRRFGVIYQDNDAADLTGQFPGIPDGVVDANDFFFYLSVFAN